MKNSYIFSYIFSLFVLAVGTVSCKEYEDVVIPMETCDTVARVEFVPGCGLQLVLENGNKVIPGNAKQVIGTTTDGKMKFEIDGLEVRENQQIIIGYKIVPRTDTSNQCNYSEYYKLKVVNVTCIVGLEKPAAS